MSNERKSVVAKPCGSCTWKKSNGSAPLVVPARGGSRTALTVARMAASCAVPAVVVDNGWLLKVAQVLDSAAVIGWVTPFTVSVVNSVGKVPMPLGVLPKLSKRKLG